MSNRHCNRNLAACVALTLVVLASSAAAETFKVDRLDDDPTATACQYLIIGDCSLRGAIIRANGNAEADHIYLKAGTYSLTVSGPGGAEEGDLDIDWGGVTIHGLAHDESIIVASGIPGGDRVFEVEPGASLTLLDVTIQGGTVTSYLGGGGIRVDQGTLSLERSVIMLNSATAGGGLLVANGTANLIASRISGNSATNYGGGLDSFHSVVTLIDSTIGPLNTAGDGGGGIYTSSDDRVTLVRSTVWGNRAYQDHGGGIHNHGVLEATNSTVSFNSTHHGRGGGVYNSVFGTAVLAHVTLAGNSDADGTASAIYSQSDMELANTLIEGTCGGSQSSYVSRGGNLESPGDTCSLDMPEDHPGIIDPMIGDLAFGGGLSPSHPLELGSPAIDTAYVFECEPTDQRQHDRLNDGDGDGQTDCDIGAYEYRPEELFLDGFESGSVSAWSSVTL